LLYDGYVFRRKETEYREAWKVANILNAWRDKKDPIIKVRDLLNWAEEDEIQSEKLSKTWREKSKGLKKGNKKKPTTPPNKSIDEITQKYLLTAGKKKEELTPEELAELQVNAVNAEVASQLDAPGARIFGRAPKEWCNFPD
jgi:hypothetical protein